MSTPESADTPGPAGTPESVGTPGPVASGSPAPADAGQPPATAHVESEPAPAPQAEDLRTAAGLGEPSGRRGGRAGARRPRGMLIIVAVLLLGAAVAGLVHLGQQNRRSFHLMCGKEAITAAQGRAFPPWGESALTGKAWQPIAVVPGTPCTSQVLPGRPALAQRFGQVLVARVEAWVLGRPDGTGREQLAGVQAELDQARLLIGEIADPAAAGAAGRALERVQGDLDYWRARDGVDAALAALDQAAAQLDQAVAREPRHNRDSAAAWQRLLARIRHELASGPNAAQPGALPGALIGGPNDAAAVSDTASASAPDSDGPHAPDTGAPVPTQDPASPARDPAAATPDTDAGPAGPALPGTPRPAAPMAPQRAAPDAGVPRGGQLI